jgi:hypothetical protein
MIEPQNVSTWQGVCETSSHTHYPNISRNTKTRMQDQVANYEVIMEFPVSYSGSQRFQKHEASPPSPQVFRVTARQANQKPPICASASLLLCLLPFLWSDGSLPNPFIMPPACCCPCHKTKKNIPYAANAAKTFHPTPPNTFASDLQRCIKTSYDEMMGSCPGPGPHIKVLASMPHRNTQFPGPCSLPYQAVRPIPPSFSTKKKKVNFLFK